MWSSRPAPMLGLPVTEPAQALSGPAAAGPRAWPALVHALADALAARFSSVSVRGEISGWSRAASGHCYFTLKDADGGDAMLRCALFRRAAAWLDFAPRNGQLVTLRGRAGGLRAARRTAVRRRVDAAGRRRRAARAVSAPEGPARGRGAVRPGAQAHRCRRLRAASASSARSVRRRCTTWSARSHGARRMSRRSSIRAWCRVRRRRRRWWRRSSSRSGAPRSMCCCCAAAAARSRTCGPSTTSAWCVRWRRARCR